MDASLLPEAEVTGMPFFKHLSERRGKLKEIESGQTLETASWVDRIVDTPLAEADYFIIDIETSGFSATTDKVLSLAAGCAKGNSLPCQIDLYDVVYHAKADDIPEHIWELTGLTAEVLRQGKEWKELLFEALKMAANHVWIAHHARHEVSFLQRHSRLLWKTSIRPIVIDTAVVAQSFLRLPSPPTLDFVCQWLEVPVENRHQADGDVLMTAEVWRRQIPLCQAQGLQTVGDVLEWSMIHAG